MEESLYNRLFQYRERQHFRPEENYLTEILAWTIENIPSFGEEYIKFLLSKLDSEYQEKLYPYKVYTQYKVTFDSNKSKYGFIDLVIITDNNIGFICEHKINSNLREEQIAKYLNCKDQIEGNINFKTVLVTKHPKQQTQEADIYITWNEIYYYFADKLKDIDDNEIKINNNLIMTKQFLNYLTEVGMGEKDPINNSAVESYCEAMKFYCEAIKFEKQLATMFADLQSEKWYERCPDLELLPNCMDTPKYYKKRWGRIGIEFCEDWENKSKEDLNINIFAGVVVDNADHQLRDFMSPQLVVLIDCFKEGRISDNLEKVFEDLPKLDSFKIETNPINEWRLIILKKPLIEVLKSCDGTYDSQKTAIYNELTQGITIILDHLKKKKIINS